MVRATSSINDLWNQNKDANPKNEIQPKDPIPVFSWWARLTPARNIDPFPSEGITNQCDTWKGGSRLSRTENGQSEPNHARESPKSFGLHGEP